MAMRQWVSSTPALLIACGLLVQLAAAAPPATRPAAPPANAASAQTPLLTLNDLKQGVAAVQFSPDGKSIAAVGGDGTLRIWDAQSGKLLHTTDKHADVPLSLAWFPNGKQIASGGADRTIRIWDAATGKKTDEFYQNSAVSQLVFLPDEKHLVAIRYDELQWWNLTPHAPLLARLVTQGMFAEKLAVTPEGDVVASDNGSHLVVFAGKDGKILAQTTPPHTGPGANRIMSIATLPKHQVFVSDRFGIFLWDSTDQAPKRITKSPAWNIAVTPDGKTLIAAVTNTLQTLDAATGQVLATQSVPDPQIDALAVSPKSDRFAVANGGSWDGQKWTQKGASAVYIYALPQPQP